MDGYPAITGPQLEKMMTIFNDGNKRNGFLFEFIATGFDARQIENLVDQAERCTPELWMSDEYSL